MRQKDWDGVIRHKTKPGLRGFKEHGCRCDEGCMEAGVVYRERERERELMRRARRQTESDPSKFTHGITGYRQYGCRCNTCVLAKQESDDAKRSRERAQYSSEMNKAPNWDELAHLRSGAGVRRRNKVPDPSFDSD